MKKRIGVFMLAMVFAPGLVWAQGWPQFRGPGSTGIASGEAAPLEWGPEQNVRWKVSIPGKGWSSPIVWGDQVVTTVAVSTERAAERA